MSVPDLSQYPWNDASSGRLNFFGENYASIASSSDDEIQHGIDSLSLYIERDGKSLQALKEYCETGEATPEQAALLEQSYIDYAQTPSTLIPVIEDEILEYRVLLEWMVQELLKRKIHSATIEVKQEKNNDASVIDEHAGLMETL